MQELITVAHIADLDGEPRISAQQLAVALGFGRVRDITKTIDRHKPALRQLGEVVRKVGAKPGVGSLGGRPPVDYWVTKKQALYLCAKSNTERSAAITIRMVEIFDAYSEGKIIPVKDHARRPPTARDPRRCVRLNGPWDMTMDQAVRVLRIMAEPIA